MANPLTMWYSPSTWGFGGGRGSKAAAHSEDVARQAEEFKAIVNEYLAQLPPGSDEANQLMAFGQKYLAQIESGAIPVSELGGAVLDQQPAATQFGSQLVKQVNDRIASGGAATPSEARSNQAFKEFREVSQPQPFEQDIYNVLGGQPTTTPFGTRIAEGMRPSGIDQELLNALNDLGVTTPIGRTFQSTVNRAAAPTIDDTAFQAAMQIVLDKVNTEAAGRGILGGGLRLEHLGRAGTEAAAIEAQRQDQLRQEAYANAIGLYDTGRQVNAGVQDFNANLFNVGEGLRERDIGVEDALVKMQLGRESDLTAMLDRNVNTRLTDFNRLLERNTAQATDNRLDLEADEAARRAALGQALGAVGGFALGGPAGAMVGTQIGGNVAGGRTTTPSAGQLLATQQAGMGGATSPMTLSRAIDIQRNPRTASVENARYIDELLRKLS